MKRFCLQKIGIAAGINEKKETIHSSILLLLTHKDNKTKRPFKLKGCKKHDMN